MWKWTAKNFSNARELMISYILTFVSRQTGELGDLKNLKLKTNYVNAKTNHESKRDMIDRLEEIIFLFRYLCSLQNSVCWKVLRSEFCMDCIEAIDTKAESRISTVGDWVKFVDSKIEQIGRIDPKKRSKKEQQFWKVCLREVNRKQHFLGIPISNTRLRRIESNVPIQK